MRTRTECAAAAAIWILCAVPSEAKVPSPGNSASPTCVRACPAGDAVVTFVARDLANNPLWDVPVELEGCDSCATALSLCAADEGGGYEILSDCSVRAYTDSTGTASFALHGGGACPGGAVIVAGGVVFGRVPVLSPDLNGDGTVDASDRDLWQTCAAALDPRAELDGAAPIDAADESVLIEHLGHACGTTVPARRSTWGSLKTIYR